jgi:DNA processing protein
MSGGADGIDTAAHRGALDARAGAGTVVVAPSSFDQPYPAKNGPLFREIVERGGAHLATRGAGAPPQLHHFFERNAVLVALVDALVVVETRFRGGARNAAKAARRLQRPVLVVPGAPWVATAGGCILELKAGASVVSTAADVLRALGLPVGRHAAAGPDPAAGSLPRGPGLGADPERAALLQVLENGPQYPDALCVQADLALPLVQALLLTLTLEGIVVSEPSGRVRLANY